MLHNSWLIGSRITNDPVKIKTYKEWVMNVWIIKSGVTWRQQRNTEPRTTCGKLKLSRTLLLETGSVQRKWRDQMILNTHTHTHARPVRLYTGAVETKLNNKTVLTLKVQNDQIYKLNVVTAAAGRCCRSSWLADWLILDTCVFRWTGTHFFFYFL